jgi:hypothetical protein
MLASFAGLDPTLRVVLVVAGIVGLYVFSGLVWPDTSCPRCEGGKHASPTGKNHRPCGRCKGSGKKARLISRLLGRR